MKPITRNPGALFLALVPLSSCRGGNAAASPMLPPVEPVERCAQATLTIPGGPDWLQPEGDSIWVATYPAAVQRVDLATNRVVASVEVRGPYGMAAGHGSLWVNSRAEKALLRIDPREGSVIAKIPVRQHDSEGSTAASPEAIWVLGDLSGVLSRIDPDTNEVVATVEVMPHSTGAAAGYGAVWVTNTGEPRSGARGSVQRVDPATNSVVATIAVGPEPRFLTAGEGAVWTLNQGDGTVSRIDPATNRVAATIAVGVPGFGGDIAAGEGRVWVRASKVLLSEIDPATNRVVRRFGPEAGSGAVRVAGGSVWISAHDVNTVWRLRPHR